MSHSLSTLTSEDVTVPVGNPITVLKLVSPKSSDAFVDSNLILLKFLNFIVMPVGFYA